MSVQESESRVQYVGNNSTATPYVVPFYFFDEDDVKVVVANASGVETELVRGPDYSVTGGGDPDGGAVLTTVAWGATYTVTVYREVPLTQTTVYGENTEFPAKSHERALDKLTMLVQQTDRKTERALRVGESSEELEAITLKPSSVFGFDALGQPRALDAGELGAFLNLTQQVFGAGVKVWISASDRASVVPGYLGQVGVQASDSSIWVATSLAAGAWVSPTSGIATGSIVTAMLADGILSADTAGRAKMASGFLSADATGRAKMADAYLSADTTGRAKMADGFLTLAKFQAIGTQRLVGRSTTGSGAPEEITVGTGLALSGGVLSTSGAGLSGSVVQTVYAETVLNSVGSTTVPIDDTKPQITEGTQILTATITPTSSTNQIRVRYGGPVAIGTSGTVTAVCALFRDSGTDALSAASFFGRDNAVGYLLFLEKQDAPASTSALTYKIRVGASSGNIYINGTSSPGRIFGGAANHYLILEEIKS